jgi:opacity protein-like surface antigen
MRFWKALLIAILMFGTGALNASAQSSHHEFEITPFGGTRFGGTIAFNPPATYTANGGSSTQIDYMTIKSSFDYGLDADYSLWPGFQLEFMWNRQPTELGAHDAVNGGIIDVGSAKLDMYHWGPLWELRGQEAKLKPFVALGVGFTHFGTDGVLPGISNRFSYSVGGGVKYEPNSHVGLRAEARYSPTHTTQQSGYEEDYFGDVYPVTVTNHANQGQANVGVIFRF